MPDDRDLQAVFNCGSKLARIIGTAGDVVIPSPGGDDIICAGDRLLRA